MFLNLLYRILANFKVLLLACAMALYLHSSAMAGESLFVMAGSASKPAIEELAAAFEKAAGVKVELNIGGSGFLLSQLKLSRKGDIYFPGSADFIEKAKKEELIIATTETKIVYLVPAINVKKGNPKKILNFKGLCEPGIKLVIANPESVCLGIFAVELAEKNLDAVQKSTFRKNIASYVESCEKTANAISLGAADAVIGWSVFEKWDPERIETVRISPDELVRLSYLSAVVTKYSKNEPLALKFIEFMKSPAGIECFKKRGYFTTPEEATAYAGKKIPIGGNEYAVPPEWTFNEK